MKISDGVLVLLITALSYLGCYSYNLGYYNAKEIPSEFISISLTSLLGVGFGLLCIFSFFSFLMDLFIKKQDELSINNGLKYFLIRNVLTFIVLFLLVIDFFLTFDFSKIIVIATILYIFVHFEFDVKENTGSKKIWNKRYSFTLKESKQTGSLMIAEKLNFKIPYVYITWILGGIFIMGTIGSVNAHLSKDILMCENGVHVIQVNDANVLVTKNYKEYTFVEKTKCNFYIDTSKSN
ncbi:hypothetical protein [Rahnella aceris]